MIYKAVLHRDKSIGLTNERLYINKKETVSKVNDKYLPGRR